MTRGEYGDLTGLGGDVAADKSNLRQVVVTSLHNCLNAPTKYEYKYKCKIPPCLFFHFSSRSATTLYIQTFLLHFELLYLLVSRSDLMEVGNLLIKATSEFSGVDACDSWEGGSL